MADRSVSVRLSAIVGPFQAAMAQAKQSTQAVKTELSGLGNVSAQTAQKLQPLGLMGVAVGGALAAGIGVGIKAFADFDAKMSESLAIMGDISGSMRKEMEDTAREVGRTTLASASEAAESYFFLASAGLDAAQSVAALPRVAKFAQAGMFDMARATDLATDAQSALGLTSQDAAENLDNLTRVTDVFVKANQLANTSVEQVSEAITNKAGAALRTFNKDVEEGAAVLALYADRGVKGAAAGEGLNVMLRDITRAAEINKAGFARLGIEVFDAQGNLKNLADVIEELDGAFSQMSDGQMAAELAALGLTRAVGDQIRILGGGADAVRAYEEELRNAEGAVDEVAGKQLENFNAQLALLKSNLLDVAMGIGQAVLPVMSAMVDVLGTMVDGFSAMPGPVKTLTGILIALTATVGLLGGGYLMLLPRIVATRTALATLGAQAKTTATILKGATIAMGGLGIAVAGASLIYGAYTRSKEEAKAATEEFARALKAEKEGIEGSTDALIARQIVDKNLDTLSADLGVSIETVTAAIRGEDAALRAVAVATENAGTKGYRLATAVGELAAAYAKGEDEAGRLETQQKRLGVATENTTGATEDGTDAAEEAADALNAYRQAIQKLLTDMFGLESATDQVTESLNAFARAVIEAQADGDNMATSLAEGTEQGLRNREMLRNLVGDITAVAEAMATQTDEQGNLVYSAADVQRAMEEQRQRLIQVLDQLGFNKAEVRRYVDVLLAIPRRVDTTVTVDTTQAELALRRLLALFAEVRQQGRDVRARIEVGEGSMSALAPTTGLPGGSSLPSVDVGGIRADVAAERSSGGAASRASAARAEAETQQRAAEEAARRAEAVTDNAYDLGLYQLDDYLRELDRRQARFEMLTPEWMEIHRRREQVLNDHASNMQAVQQAQRSIEDNMHEAGYLSNDEYRKILEERLASLVEFSDEWMAVWRQINQIQDNAVDELVRSIELWDEKNRERDAFMEAAEQRRLTEMREAQQPAMVMAGSTTTNFNSQFNVTAPSPERAAETVSQQMRDDAYLRGF
jgi:TP901 family phage tail tape measure protein